VTWTLPRLRPEVEGPTATAGETRSGQIQTLCVVLAFVGLGYALRHSGGRERGTTEVALALAAPSVFAGRVWRRLSVLELASCASVAGAAVLLPFITPLGVSVAPDLNAYTYAVIMYLAVRGFVQNDEHRRVVAVACLCLGVVEFIDVIRVWVGENDPSFQMVGTFYWHNQFGAFAAAIALLASAMAMRSSRLEDAIGWLIAPLFLALAWLSHSRGALLALLLTAVFLPGVALVRRHWWALARAVCVLALAFAVHGLLIAAVSGSGNGHGFSPGKDSLASTSTFRLTAAEEGMKVFARAPLVSHGYGSLPITGWQHTPRGTTTSPYAHSAEVQALSDGGILLGLPVIVAIALLGWTAVRGAARASRRSPRPEWLPLGASLAAIAMLLHASMDFDSQYPVLLALLVVVVAIAAPATTTALAHDSRGLRRLMCVVTLAATLLGGFLVAAYWQTGQRVDRARSLLLADSASSIRTAALAMSDHHFTDPRPAEFIVLAADLGYPVDEPTLREALHESRSYAHIHPPFDARWERVNSAVLATSGATAARTTRP
jgi:hypothetical protein